MRYTEVFVALAAVEFDRALQFYAQLLQQPPQPHVPGRYGEFQMGGLRLGIFKPKASHEAEFAGPSGGLSLCIEVANLEEAIAHLSQLGYPPEGAIMVASHGRELYAYDPDGNRLIVHEAIQH